MENLAIKCATRALDLAKGGDAKGSAAYAKAAEFYAESAPIVVDTVLMFKSRTGGAPHIIDGSAHTLSCTCQAGAHGKMCWAIAAAMAYLEKE